MKRKLSITLAIMLVTTNLASCQSTQSPTPIDVVVNSNDFTASVITNNDATNIEENNTQNDVALETEIPTNETENLNYTDLPLHEEVNDLMFEDMQKLTIMPQEFLDYCAINSIEVKIEELEYPIDVFNTLYSIVKDGAETKIGAILDLTNDSTEIFYHNSNNAESLKVNRNTETGEFTGGYILLGKTISVSRDLDGNIVNIDSSNQELNQIYVDKTLELHEFYQYIK